MLRVPWTFPCHVHVELEPSEIPIVHKPSLARSGRPMLYLTDRYCRFSDGRFGWIRASVARVMRSLCKSAS